VLRRIKFPVETYPVASRTVAIRPGTVDDDIYVIKLFVIPGLMFEPLEVSNSSKLTVSVIVEFVGDIVAI
jgi:hypothetical protein